VWGDAGESNWSDADISTHLADLKLALKNHNTASLEDVADSYSELQEYRNQCYF